MKVRVPRGWSLVGLGSCFAWMRVPWNPGSALQGGVRMVLASLHPQHLSMLNLIL